MSAGKDHFDFENWLTTQPATQVEFSVKLRDQPCWRCRFHLRWPPWRVHWQCRKPPALRYIEPR